MVSFLKSCTKEDKKKLKKTIRRIERETVDVLGEVRVDMYRLNMSIDLSKKRELEILSKEIDKNILKREILSQP